MRKSNKGITLIALIITIIILLILAGITISLVIGDNSILDKAMQAGRDYSEQAARERLEIALANLGTDKIVDMNYNEMDFIDGQLTKEGFIVNGNIVLVDGWLFEIDRSVPKIINSLGKGKLNPSIIIEATSKNTEDYTSSTIQVSIRYPGTITSIVIAGEEIAVPEPIDGVYYVTKVVTTNGSYGILVKDEKEDYKTANIKITDITEDMDIYTKEDMESFRDKVNKGATFLGRTVRLMNDIDLQGNSTNQWIPIGKNTTGFSGIFNGQYHKINGLYATSQNEAELAFITTLKQEGIIRNTTIENCYFENKLTISISSTGGFVDNNYGLIENCSVSGKIVGIRTVNTSEYSSIRVAGISAINYGIIRNCYNLANIIGSNSLTSGNLFTGGISSNSRQDIINCYNVGNIEGASAIGYIGGIVGFLGEGTGQIGKVENSYNIGTIKQDIRNFGAGAGIVGCKGSNTTSGSEIIRNSYSLDTSSPYTFYNYINPAYKPSIEGKISREQMQAKEFITKLGEAFSEDINNINNGYPILKWQVGQ